MALSKKRRNGEKQKNILIRQGAQNKRVLAECEDRILDVLAHSGSDILEDETASETLSSSKAIANEIQAKQAEAEETEYEIDHVRHGYKPVAAHACKLFYCVSRLSSIEPVYQYSLKWFISLFITSISKSLL